jgi:hypothetical protein
MRKESIVASAALNVMVNLEDGEHLHDHTGWG